jgi:hypothetical protein
LAENINSWQLAGRSWQLAGPDSYWESWQLAEESMQSTCPGGYGELTVGRNNCSSQRADK